MGKYRDVILYLTQDVICVVGLLIAGLTFGQAIGIGVLTGMFLGAVSDISTDIREIKNELKKRNDNTGNSSLV